MISGTPTDGGHVHLHGDRDRLGRPDQTATKQLSITIIGPLVVTTTTLPSGSSARRTPAHAAVVRRHRRRSRGRCRRAPCRRAHADSPAVRSAAPRRRPARSTFTVTATDSGTPAQTATKQPVDHDHRPLVVTTTTLPSGVGGTAYAGAQLASTGGTGNGHVDGPAGHAAAGPHARARAARSAARRPTAGTFAFTVTATDSGSPVQSATKQPVDHDRGVARRHDDDAALGRQRHRLLRRDSSRRAAAPAAVTWTVPPGTLPPGSR